MVRGRWVRCWADESAIEDDKRGLAWLHKFGGEIRDEAANSWLSQSCVHVIEIFKALKGLAVATERS